MDSELTTLASWSYGLAGIGYALFALQLAIGWRRRLRGAVMLAAVGLSALWGLLGLAFAYTGSPTLLGATAFADVLRLAGWYAFLLLLVSRPGPEPEAERSYPGRWLMPVAIGVIAASLAAQILVLTGVESLGDPLRLVLLTALGQTVFGLVLVEQLFRNVPEEGRWDIKPLCLGLAAALVFDVYVYADAVLFNRLDADAFSVRGFVHALVIPLLALSAARSRDGSFQVALSRHVVFRSAALVAAGAYLLFMAGAGYYVRFFGGEWGRALQVALLFAAALFLGVAAFSGSVRARLRVLVNKHFFRYRYDYREEWLRFTQALASADGQSELGQQVIRGLADMVESPGGALWLRDRTGAFAQAARWNVPASGAVEPAEGELARFLEATGWVVNLEELRSVQGRYGDLRLPPWLGEYSSAWLVVPLSTGAELIGFAILATARAPMDVNWEVNDLLKTAARQAASYLGQVQATEALLEARKFDAFNRMSAFVVHDLKNIVSQLSLMLKNAERHRDNPEFQQDMLMTVEHSVDRMRQLMMQLREGTTPVNVPSGVELREIVRSIQRAKKGQEPAVEVEEGEPLVAKGHRDRIERVIGHLVQNALDATERSGRVWVRMERQGDNAVIEVGDTGHGMTPEFVRERLFRPFQTTKQAGMGIGAYESFHYVQELGGQVAVESAPNVGTRVRLLLPLHEAANAAGRRSREQPADALTTEVAA